MDHAESSDCENSANFRLDILDQVFAIIIENACRYPADGDVIRREFLEPLAMCKVELDQYSPLSRTAVAWLATTFSHLSAESEPVRKYRKKAQAALIRKAKAKKPKSKEWLKREEYLSQDLMKPGAIRRLLKKAERDGVKIPRSTIYRRRKRALKAED